MIWGRSSPEFWFWESLGTMAARLAAANKVKSYRSPDDRCHRREGCHWRWDAQSLIKNWVFGFQIGAGLRLCLWKRLVQETKGAAQRLTSKRPAIKRLLSKCPAAPCRNRRCPQTKAAGSSPVSNSRHCVVVHFPWTCTTVGTVCNCWIQEECPESRSWERFPQDFPSMLWATFEVFALKCIIEYLICKAAIELTLSECLQHEELATFGQ